MLFCPFCKTENKTDAEECVKCGGDISILSSFYHLPHYFFNQGLKYIKEENIPEALVHLSAAVAFDPKSAKNLILLAKMLANMGMFDMAEYFVKKIPEEKRGETGKEILKIAGENKNALQSF